MAQSLTPDSKMVKEYMIKVDEKIGIVVDSLNKEALGLEAAKKYKGALSKYEEILSYSPENQQARDRIDAINKLVAAAKPKPKPKPKPEPKPEVNVNKIYQQGISFFSQKKYKSAIAKFNQVLKYKPGHSGARTYRKKAQARLKALGG